MSISFFFPLPSPPIPQQRRQGQRRPRRLRPHPRHRRRLRPHRPRAGVVGHVPLGRATGI